jgi:Zn ribbon nucleic-acid-binding protein
MSKKIDDKTYAERVTKLTNGEYSLTGNYKGKYELVKIKHNICGHEFEVQAQTINNNGGKCPICNVRNTLYNKEEVQLKINRIIGTDEYEVVNYVNKKTKIDLFHKKCESNIQISMANIKKGQRCPVCESGYTRLKNPLKTFESFKKDVKTLGLGEYELISSNYKNNKTKVEFLHKKCNQTYFSTPNAFINGNRCPKCKISFNEEKIKKFLDDKGISYIPQFRVKLKDRKRPLFMDFFLTDLNIGIEYDGEFHYHDLFATDDLEKRQERDRLKDKFCKENNIKLLRIPYWEKNHLEQILEEFLEGSTTIESASKDGSE